MRLSNSRCGTNCKPTVMNIFTLFPALTFASFCHFGWSLIPSYPPKIRSNENSCSFEWTFSTNRNFERSEKSGFKQKLFRIDGKEVGYVRNVNLVPGKGHQIITRSLKPPIFEIPDFLTKEECEHLIKRAEKVGLTLSEVGLTEENNTNANDFAENCTDNDYRCVKWAKRGECKKNPTYMLKNCRQSCEVCQDDRDFDYEHWDLNKNGILSGYELIKATKMLYFLFIDEDDVLEIPDHNTGISVPCSFRIVSGISKDLETVRFITSSYPRRIESPAICGRNYIGSTFISGPLCEDNEASCSQLAKEGACHLYPQWMLLTCRKSCGNCGCEDLAANCSSLAASQKCMDDGHAYWMLGNCRRSCKVCLGAINYETYQSMNTNDIYKYLKTMSHKHPRHRSRYSYTAFLHSNEKDPLQNMMIDRVEKLTQLPREMVEGAESLQVVKYDKYGHYHAHYDSSLTGDIDLICCYQVRDKPQPCRLCRLLTILYYLNNVDEGGETAFIIADNSTLNETLLLSKRGKEDDPFNLSNFCQSANLVIAPKRGTAVMWYNHHLDSDGESLGERDPYTLHGGCDVKKGNKWIANHWIPASYKNYRHLPSIYRRRNPSRT